MYEDAPTFRRLPFKGNSKMQLQLHLPFKGNSKMHIIWKTIAAFF